MKTLHAIEITEEDENGLVNVNGAYTKHGETIYSDQHGVTRHSLDDKNPMTYIDAVMVAKAQKEKHQVPITDYEYLRRIRRFRAPDVKEGK